jgi:hypothetical protein
MKVPACILMVALASLTACSSSPNAGMRNPTDSTLRAVESISETKTAFLAAWTKEPGQTFTTQKLSQVVSTTMDVPSARFLSFDGMSPTSTVLEGWETYSALWGPGMNGFTKASLTEVRPVGSWANDTMGVTASIVRIYGEMPDGKVMDTQGHLTLTYQKFGDSWRIIHEHMSLGVKP